MNDQPYHLTRREKRLIAIADARALIGATGKRIAEMPFKKRVSVMLDAAAARPRKGRVELLKVARKGECALMRATDLALGRGANHFNYLGNRAARRLHADRMYRFAV